MSRICPLVPFKYIINICVIELSCFREGLAIYVCHLREQSRDWVV